MKKYKYTEKDLDFISWDRIDKFVEKIHKDVSDYISKNNLSIKYIAPILRGGGVPAIMLSHMFNVVDMLPIQLKYDSNQNDVKIKIDLSGYKNLDKVSDNQAILLVEGNHCTGKTANMAVDIIRKTFGDKIKIIYVSLTRDYAYRNSVKDVSFTTWAMTTNETKNLTEEECKKLNINYYLISVYPWENAKEELEEINAYDIY